MGGVKTNAWGETDLPGLFAAGECACVSVHGANRLGGNSLLETIVFGRRAGTRAAEAIRDCDLQPVPEEVLKGEEQRLKTLLINPGPERAWQIRDDLGKTMSLNLGIFRTKQSMQEALGYERAASLVDVPSPCVDARGVAGLLRRNVHLV